MAAPPPPPPRRPRRRPELMDELLEEVLFRLPPDEPAHLARAALVCKRWCRLVLDPGFRRRFRQFHRTPPPLLGLIISSYRRATATHFLPTSSSFKPSGGSYRSGYPLDVRHGRILLCYDPVRSNPARQELIVWTPVTGEARTLPRLVLPNSYRAYRNAALLCAAPGCDHMECAAGGPFSVVLVGRTTFQRCTAAYIYSSEADKWSQTASAELPWYVEQRRNSSTLAWNALYFLLQHNKGILEYDLSKKELSPVIALPSICDDSSVILLMSVEDDRLGFTMVNDDFSLCIWLAGSAPTLSGGWTWMKHKVVDLKGFLPGRALSCWPYIIAAADTVSVFVIWAGDAGVFTIDLKSGRRRTVFEWFDADAHNVNIIPYMSFCTPGFRAASIDNGRSTIASINA